jgi:RND family efflux transporter MFP subunit
MLIRTSLIIILLLPTLALAQVPVQMQPLGEILVDLEYRAPADVQPLNDALMSAEVSAVVAAVLADVGQQVEPGQLMLQLDATDYQLNLRQAEANLASSLAQKAEADAKLRRARELGQNQYVSADELLERETRVMVISAQIQAHEVAVSVARRNLDKCSVTAPFAGVVAERMAQVGSFVTNGSPLLRLTQMDRFELDAEIPAKLADSLHHAQALYFESRGQRWPVELLRLSPAIETARRSRRARFAFVADAPTVGRSGELVWHVEKGLLPANLVTRRNGELGVFLHQDGRAVFTPLPDAQEGRPVAVEFPAGTEVIVRGRDRLQDGDTVTVSD